MAGRKKKKPSEWIHGSSCYVNHACKCAVCRREWSKWQKNRRAQRAKELALDPTLTTHGTESTYTNWSCRCTPCRLAHNQYGRALRARRAEALWQTL